MTGQKSYLLMARGSSHIRYFRAFAKASALPVEVVKVNREAITPGCVVHLSKVSRSHIASLLSPHVAKKARKYPTLSNTPLWWLYKKCLSFYLKVDVAKYIGIIQRKQPDVVGVWNGQKLPSATIAVAAAILGKDVVHFENGLLPDSTTCDWSGVNCLNSLPRDAGFYLKFAHDMPLPQHLIPRSPLKEKAKGIDVESLPEKFVFVPFQVETDSQIITNSPWIKSMEQFYELLCRVVDKVGDPELRIVIKEHPSEITRHDALHHRHPHILFANQCNTKTLIEKSDAVLTINSTVGLESLLLGKPVMVMGKACYALDGVCTRIDNEEALVAALAQPGASVGEPEIRRGFLNFLYQYYVIPEAWSRAETKHFEALTKRLLKTDQFSKFLAEYHSASDVTLLH